MLPISLQHNVDLSHLNTFRIRVYADFFIVIKSLAQIQNLLQDPHELPANKYILGEGSNILFTQNYPGLIIKNEIKGIELIAEDNDSVLLKIGAGENWHELIEYCIAREWGGIENLSLIPGTVGAAPIQNIGAYGAELKDVFYELEAINLNDGSLQIFKNAQCQFGYRESIFKSTLKNQFMITAVTLKLSKKPIFNTQYGAIHATLEAMKIKTLSLRAISDAVMSIRQSKLPDPKIIGNAGSFFKNPLITKNHFNQLQQNFTDIPFFSETTSDLIKIPAAWLIEQCGWKGKRLGEVGVHEKQALVLVNYGLGTGKELKELAQQIQESVQSRFDIQLMTEVNIL